jgi:hypothetical protein
VSGLTVGYKNVDYGDVRLPDRPKPRLQVEPARELPKGHWRYAFRERAIPGQSLGCLIVREYCGLTLMRQDVAWFVDPALLALGSTV